MKRVPELVFKLKNAGTFTSCHVQLLLLGLVLFSKLSAGEINTQEVEKSHKLENIRSQIREVESSIDSAKSDVEQLYLELEENESKAALISGEIRQLEVDIESGNEELARLETESRAQEQVLSEQRLHLSQQIRAAYKTGRSNYLQLLLNQQSPDRVGRVLAYYNYDVKARGRRIALIQDSLAELSRLQEKVEVETAELTRLKQAHSARLVDFRASRASREETRTRLEAFIQQQGNQLQLLQQNELQLSRLVDELKQEDLAVQIFEDMTPFRTLKGSLDWPVKGKILSRFGSLRKGGKLKWQGVTIAASSGVEVKAVTTGKVVFADWFRNMGLLMILDHGEGYMSLYGHNERLLKKPGDWVLAGETIARVGDSGGQGRSALYFEIRQGGSPVNPALWCRN